MRFIDGQLFRLSLQEQPRPRYLLYYTVDFPTPDRFRERTILIDTETFGSYEAWDNAGQPITDVIPVRYNKPKKRRFANVPEETTVYKPLDKAATQEVFSRLRTEIHDVIWGGGGTNSNEVFVCIVRLILCKIYDEKEIIPERQYEFQRLGDEVEPETPEALALRLNALYLKAERAYLALPRESEGQRSISHDFLLKNWRMSSAVSKAFLLLRTFIRETSLVNFLNIGLAGLHSVKGAVLHAHPELSLYASPRQGSRHSP